MSGLPSSTCVFTSTTPRPSRGSCPPCSASSRSVASSGPKTLTSIGLLHAGEVVDLIEHQRNEFGLQLGDLFLRAPRAAHRTSRPSAAAGPRASGSREYRRYSSRWRRSPARRRCGGCSPDVGRFEQDLLDAAEDLVGLAQRRAHRHLVIEDERPLVHLGHEAGLQRGSRRHTSRSDELSRATSTQPGTTARGPATWWSSGIAGRTSAPVVAVGQQVIDRAGRGHRPTPQEPRGQDRDDR